MFYSVKGGAYTAAVSGAVKYLEMVASMVVAGAAPTISSTSTPSLKNFRVGMLRI